MTLIILLFAVGLVLLAVEVIVPGGILGVAGSLLLLGASVLSFAEFGTTGGAFVLAASVFLSSLTVCAELWIFRRTAVGKKAFLDTAITGQASAFREQARILIGKDGESMTMLSPSGYVRVDGKSYEAFCQTGQMPAGAPLRVVGADNFRLIVSPTHTH